MQKDKYAKVQPRPTKAAPINITPEFIHATYELKSKPISFGTDTGHLEIFRLEPTIAGQPTFSARWDCKPNTIDIDLIGDEDASREFKAGSGDYRGHHSITLSESPLT